MCDCIYSLMSLNHLLYKDQYGLHAGHPTEFALLIILDVITVAWENKQIVISVMMDLKAFDIMDHSILLKKLWLIHD